jgi:F0F1-type ATP synthase alpha subunit
MGINVEEISRIIRKQVEDYGTKVEVSETGSVISVGDGIARIYGLEKAMAGELLEFPASNGGESIYGMVLNLEEDNVGAALLSNASTIREGDTVRRTGRIVEIPVGPIPPGGGTVQDLTSKARQAEFEKRNLVIKAWLVKNPLTPTSASTASVKP